MILLSVVTLGFYGLYWTPSMSAGVNHVIGRRQFSFWLILLVSLFTLGIGGSIFEVWYAYSIQSDPGYRVKPWANRNLGNLVLGLNAGAYLIAFATAGIGLVISIALGLWSSWMIQDVINRYLEPGGEPLDEKAAAPTEEAGQ